jgi:hypothetical protein
MDGCAGGGLLLVHNGQKQSRLALDLVICGKSLSFRDEPHTSSVFCSGGGGGSVHILDSVCDLRNLSVYQMLSSLSRYM